MIRNSKIKSLLTLGEPKLFAFNRCHMRLIIMRSNHDKVFITLLTSLRETH